MGTAAAICAIFSFSNILLQRQWNEVLSLDFGYHSSRVLTIASWGTIFLQSLALTAAFTAILLAGRALLGERCDRTLAFVLIGIGLVVYHPDLKHFNISFQSFIGVVLWSMTWLILLAGIATKKLHHRWVWKGLLLVLPFFFVDAVTLVIRMVQYRDAYALRPTVALPSSEPRKRLVWIIFDELDQRLTFDERPIGLKLPEFDRLRAESIYAANAYPPPGIATEISLPALISGRVISGLDIGDPDHLKVLLPGKSETIEWDSDGTVFSDAAALQIATSIDGYYNPYCRLISGLSACKTVWERNAFVAQLLRHAGVGALATAAFERLHDPEKQVRETHIGTYRSLLPSALDHASDPRLGLVVLHLPVPHPPGIYDRARSVLSISSSSSYEDNLVLADITLAQIRGAMDRTGVSDRTTLLVTGDHGLRGFLHASDRHINAEDLIVFNHPMDHRVPFLLKLAGQRRAFELSTPFNTTVSRKMIIALLRGDLSTADEVLPWLKINSEPPGPEAPSRAQLSMPALTKDK